MIDTELKWDVGLKMATQNLRFNDVFFCRRIFQIKETENAFPFLWGCRCFRESMGELKKIMETAIFLLVFHAFLALWSFHSLFYSTIRRWLRDFYSAVVEEGAARVREQFNCVGQRDQSTSRSTLYLNPPDRQCENAKSGRPFVIKRTLRAT